MWELTVRHIVKCIYLSTKKCKRINARHIVRQNPGCEMCQVTGRERVNEEASYPQRGHPNLGLVWDEFLGNKSSWNKVAVWHESS